MRTPEHVVRGAVALLNEAPAEAAPAPPGPEWPE